MNMNINDSKTIKAYINLRSANTGKSSDTDSDMYTRTSFPDSGMEKTILIKEAKNDYQDFESLLYLSWYGRLHDANVDGSCPYTIFLAQKL